MFQWPVDEGFSKSCHRHVRRVAFGVPRMRARKLAWVSRGFLDAGNGYRSQKTPRPCVHSLPNPTSPSHPPRPSGKSEVFQWKSRGQSCSGSGKGMTGVVSRQLQLPWSVTPWADPGKRRRARDPLSVPLQPLCFLYSALQGAIVKSPGAQTHWEQIKVI